MFNKILIANRGEIALRVIRACKELGISTVAVYSEADEASLHVKFADEAICIGPSVPKKSYLNIPSIISAAELTNSDAIHPGYGFLSESSEFCKICEEHNIRFIGPTPKTIDLMGDKSQARKFVNSLSIPVIPGTKQPVLDADEANLVAEKIGFPVILKAVSGGGGKGMRVVESPDSMKENLATAKNEALNAFKDDQVYIEKFLINPRHIEVQILADKFNNIYILGDRDCSIQRNHQKIIEETPSVRISDIMREELYKNSKKIAKKCDYIGAGTVEFLVVEQNCYFIEMNTRIQVEHPITEMIFSIDLLQNQILAHAGYDLSKRIGKELKSKGHSIECRITAEDPDNNFMPSPGSIESLHFPGGLGVRIDSHIYSGYKIPPNYDSMIAKIITYADTREECIMKMISALSECVIEGVKTIIPYHLKILNNKAFNQGKFNTGFLKEFNYKGGS
tara:strand:+ start:456 stop:1808 length:1353 start_codon:yes stop_codon:yes gene_type:complete